MKLRDVLRGIRERLLWRSHSHEGNGVQPQPQGQAATPPLDEAAPLVQENWGDNPIYARSHDAYYRNLLDLLKKHESKWVAYHGDECIGIARTQTELWHRCIHRGLKPGEFYIDFIFTGAFYDTHVESVPAHWRTNPLFICSQEAYHRDLADLRTKYDGQWVAYHGDEFVCAGTIKEAWECCLRRGLNPGEFSIQYVSSHEQIDYDTELGWAEKEV